MNLFPPFDAQSTARFRPYRSRHWRNVIGFNIEGRTVQMYKLGLRLSAQRLEKRKW